MPPKSRSLPPELPPPDQIGFANHRRALREWSAQHYRQEYAEHERDQPQRRSRGRHRPTTPRLARRQTRIQQQPLGVTTLEQQEGAGPGGAVHHMAYEGWES